MKAETEEKVPQTQSSRPNPYELVTNVILGHLGRGTVPWRCPWNRKVGRPMNFMTGRAYQGVNLLLLGCRRFASRHWLTIRQANMLGGHVRKGEHGTMVVKYGKFQRRSNVEEADDARRSSFYLKGYVVFNELQVEGIEFPLVETTTERSIPERIAAAERIVTGMSRKPTIKEGDTVQAAYHPKTDTVEMPALARFESGEAYYLTLFHELTHSTGHESRLNRSSLMESNGFLSRGYSKEELVAEMGAAFLGMEAEITQDEHESSAAYLKGWLDVLREPDHRRWIVEAGNQATKAAQYILGAYVPQDQAEA